MTRNDLEELPFDELKSIRDDYHNEIENLNEKIENLKEEIEIIDDILNEQD
jgi:uncharacterized coiled-coil DUF342 family protein